MESSGTDKLRHQLFYRFFYFIGFIAIGLAIGISIIWVNQPLFAVATLLGILLAALIAVRVEWALLILVFITQSNLSTTLIEQFGIPSVAKILVSFIILVLLVRITCAGYRPEGWRTITLLILVYGIVGLFSIFLEPYYVDDGLVSLTAYIKDSAIAIITVLIIQKQSTLRYVCWALILSGTMLGTVALIQHLTGTYNNDYWGLSISPSAQIIGAIDDHRLAGTVGDPNFFALFQYILLPLSVERILTEKRYILKLLAAYCTGTILFTVIFSYSRGGFLGIIVMLFVLFVLYRKRVGKLFVGAFLTVILILPLAGSRYAERMLTLGYFTNQDNAISMRERSFEGRTSEMLVAGLIFLDHPISGIGLGNYPNYYQVYAQKLFIDFRKEKREAHCRYLEILAETGLIGLIAFSTIIGVMIRGLIISLRQSRIHGFTELEYTTAAIFTSIIGLLIGFIFLHDAWPRFGWLLFGIAFSIPNVLSNMLAERTSEEIDFGD